MMAAACLCACAPSAEAPTDPTPQFVRVISTDYAFEAPDTITAGLVTWQLENRGDDGHHLIVYRIDDGHTVEEALAATRIDGPWPAWFRSLGGPEGTEDAEEGGTFTMRLAPGEYLLACAIRHPDGGTHASHGMVHRLVVVGDDESGSDPVATDTIRMIDFAFAIHDTVFAGDLVFEIVNEGVQRHHAVLERIPGDADLARALADLDQEEPPPGYHSFGGFTSLAPGERGWYQVRLEPGRYLFGCLIADPATGSPHFELGMVRLVEVVSRGG